MSRASDVAQLACSIPLLVAILGCDGGTESAPTEMNLAQNGRKRPPSGDAVVTAVVNHNPILSLISSDGGSLATGVPVVLTARATDPDGDRLLFAWSTACPGALRNSKSSCATFVPAALDGRPLCEFDVLVGDGKGGAAKGVLSLSNQRPVLNVAPQIGIVWQSTAAALIGESVALHAAASDPEGRAITWSWQDSGGELGSQDDATAGESNITWTSPSSAGAYTVTAVASDSLGASASYTFAIEVVSRQP